MGKRNLSILKKIKSRNGFSLAETMVTVFLFVLVAGGLYLSVLVGQNSWQVNAARLQLQRELRKAAEWMKYDIMQAGPTSVVNIPPDGIWRSTVMFKIPSGISGGNIVWQSDYIIFAKVADQQTLVRLQGAEEQIIAQNVELVQFRRQEQTPKILEIALTGQSQDVKGTSLSYQTSFQIQLRN